MSMQLCLVWALDDMALQPRKLLKAYGTDINSEKECEIDPGLTSNVDNTRKTTFT